MAEIPRFRNQEVEMGGTPLTLTHTDALAKGWLPDSMTSCSAALEV